MATLVCSICGRNFIVTDAPAALGASCPECQQEGGQKAVQHPSSISDRTLVCGICLSPIEPGAATASCLACTALYHQECWQENGGCAIYGCTEAPPVEQRSSVEIPVSYWGQENKPCPACGKEILAAAIRCRFCGATFASAKPEDASIFYERSARNERLPKLRQSIVWMFVLSVIPCTALIGGLWGLIMFATRRSDVNALPSLYSALCKIGIAVGLGQTILMALISLMYSIAHHS